MNNSSPNPLNDKVSITLDTEIIQRIKELAEADNRNFSPYANLFLHEHIKEK